MDIHSNRAIEIRENFIKYFRNQGYRFLKPSKIYNDDPTLFFVNAGMCQLKPIFMGLKEPEKNYMRLTNSQICVRAGGKHNDLDDVGYDSYHLTSFEMLGTWILDDFSRVTPIHDAFKFLVEECGLDPLRLYGTYYEGSPEIEEDLESKNALLEVLPAENIIRGSHKDNFWSMGPDGTCGPCVEFHYDLQGNRGNMAHMVNMDDPTVVEIWNLVFTTYNKSGTEYTRLPRQYLDTGCGLERLCMVIQDKPTIYRTDAFRYLLGYSQAITNGSMFGDSYDNNSDASHRIFADHMRTCTVALHQGIDFGTHERGNILRKIFRRLLSHTYINLTGKIRPVMRNLAVNAMISDILNYFMEKTHDSEGIWKKMIEEEEAYIGIITFAKRKYQKYMKKLGDHDLVVDKLKTTEGIGEEVLDFLTHQ